MSEADGRAGQEAARLLSAAQDWLRSSAPHLAPVTSDGETCSCPLCRAVVAAREADPDTLARWVDAAVLGVSSALAHAATAASDLASASSPQHQDGDGGDDDDTAPNRLPQRQAAEVDELDDDTTVRDVRRIPLDHELGPDLP